MDDVDVGSASSARACGAWWWCPYVVVPRVSQGKWGIKRGARVAVTVVGKGKRTPSRSKRLGDYTVVMG